MGQKFAQNRSISYSFWYYSFLISAKIQDGHQKCWNWNFSFLYRIPFYCRTGKKINSKSLYYLARWEIIIGKWFLGKKMPDDSAHTLGVKNFVEISLCRTISNINEFCVLCRITRWPKLGKWFLGETARWLSRCSGGHKFCRNCSILQRFWDMWEQYFLS